MAKKITANAPLAVQAMKEAALAGLEESLEKRLRIGGTTLARVMETKDAQEGLRAFEEKRAPVWRGE
jgi:enoyl-CoA hydratase